MIEAFQHHNLKPFIRYSSSDFSYLMSLCRQGKGAAPVPESRLPYEKSDGLIAVQVAPDDDPGWDIYYIRKNGVHISYALQMFEDTLKDILDQRKKPVV